jgi:hypothetical protein
MLHSGRQIQYGKSKRKSSNASAPFTSETGRQSALERHASKRIELLKSGKSSTISDPVHYLSSPVVWPATPWMNFSQLCQFLGRFSALDCKAFFS